MKRFSFSCGVMLRKVMKKSLKKTKKVISLLLIFTLLFTSLLTGIGPIKASATSIPCLQTLIPSGNDFYALMSDGTVKSRGYNTYGELGLGNTYYYDTFTTVPGLSGVIQLLPAREGDGTYALLSNGTVMVCGHNSYGELGLGNTNQYTSFTAVSGLTGVAKLFSTDFSVYALMSDGTVKDCGYNYYGQLGQGNTMQYNSFTTVSGLSGVRELITYCYDVSALMNDGTVKSCGQNYNGELGVGYTSNRLCVAESNNCICL